MIYTIYSLSHPVTKEVQYVGRTKRSLEGRFIRHITTAFFHKKTAVQMWIVGLMTQGLCPLMEILEETDDKTREKYWISLYRDRGNDMKNYVHTKEHSAKIAASRKGIKFTDAHLANMSKARKGVSVGKGKVLSAATKAKISQTLKGNRNRSTK